MPNDTMNRREAAALEILIGAPIEHESERSTLRKIEQLLAADGRRAIVFANFEIHGRQIDLLVALDDVVLVIETKGFTRPVRGGENGNWQVHLSSGQWKDFRNPYRQTLNAALAVKNAAGALGCTDAPYVNAVLAFSPGIPPGSGAFPGNGKVSVIGEDDLGKELAKRTQGSWSVERWREFADALGLKWASSVCAACDARLSEAEDRLRQYGTVFRQTYNEGAALVPFTCESSGAAVSSSDVVRAVAEGRAGKLFHGPSGCGKTMLAASSGVAFSERGGVSICVQGKDFSGSARDLLKREATLLGMPSAKQLLEDAQRLNRPILLIVDGYNECREDRRGLLTRIVAALAYRYEAEILVTSQLPLVRGDLLELQTFEVRAPTLETKIAIAKQASECKADSQEVGNLLGAVSSGLEARLVGEIDDDRMLEWLLPKLEDHEPIRHCLEGRCGRQAQEWAEEHCRRLWIRLREEACNVRYRMDRGGVGCVEFEESSLAQWSLCDRAFFGVIPALIADGRNLKNALEIVGIMDRRITDEADRLCSETKVGRWRLRSDLFAISNVHPHRTSGAPGISMICTDLSSGVFMVRNGLLGRSDKTRGAEIRQEVMLDGLLFFVLLQPDCNSVFYFVSLGDRVEVVPVVHRGDPRGFV